MKPRRHILPLLLLSTLAATTVEPLPPTQKPRPSILAEPPDATTEPTAFPAPLIWLQRHLIALPDALEKAPDNLRPRRGDKWTQSTQSPFITWSTEELLGTLFEHQLRCTAATAQPAAQPHQWQLQPTVETRDFLCFGTMQTWTLSFSPLLIDDKTLAQWRTYHRGCFMTVKGRIQSVNISRCGDSPTGLPQFQFNITLAQPEVFPPAYPPFHRHNQSITQADTTNPHSDHNK